MGYAGPSTIDYTAAVNALHAPEAYSLDRRRHRQLAIIATLPTSSTQDC